MIRQILISATCLTLSPVAFANCDSSNFLELPADQGQPVAWIDTDMMMYPVERSSSIGLGATANHRGDVTMKDITFTRTMDSSSSQILFAPGGSGKSKNCGSFFIPSGPGTPIPKGAQARIMVSIIGQPAAEDDDGTVVLVDEGGKVISSQPKNKKITLKPKSLVLYNFIGANMRRICTVSPPDTGSDDIMSEQITLNYELCEEAQ